MHPELFSIGPFTVHSYGVLLAISFILGIFIAIKKGEKRDIKSDEIINVGFIIIISSIIGARLFYVLFHLSEFEGRWLYTFWPVQEDGTVGLGGLILLGGFIAALLSSIVYILYKKLNFWKLADSMIPGFALGIFLTRIGCYLNGCCFGKECHLPWAVKFPPGSPAGSTMGDLSLHPTQLYSSLYALIIFFILMMLDRFKLLDGITTGMFFILYGISRFIVDFFRFYEEQMFILTGLGVNQLVSLFMFLTGVVIIFYRQYAKKSDKLST
jgi:phosphatidylglycerol:prolipoprotein diacylglycerol transferase